MSQARVTDFFSTRKRTTADEALINKEKRVNSVETQITTRSRAASSKKSIVVVAEEAIQECKEATKVVVPEEVVVVVAAPEAGEKKEVIKKKQQLNAKELKEKMQNFKQKLQTKKNQLEEKRKQEEEDKASEKEAEVKNNITPAFEKYANLAASESEHEPLALPVKYQNLLQLFKGSDTVLKFMHNRQEVVTYLKLKNSVQNMTKKNFTQANLGQFKTVYPNSYSFKQEKLYIDFKNDYHLTIEPIFEKDIKTNENGVKMMSPLLLLERLQRFKTRLYEMVRDVHLKFLKSIGVTVNPKDIKRYHPKFDLEEIDDIIAAELPQKPNEVKLTTGEDLKNIAKEVYSVRVKSAIDAVLKEQEKLLEVVSNTQVTKASTSQSAGETLKEKQKSNYNALLEKIRVKERHKDLENMIVNSDKTKRLQLLDKYSECIRFIKSYFQAEKKATIDLETVSKKMHESLNSHTANECEEIIREMCKDFNKWICIIKVRQLEYVKTEKKFELSELLTNVASMIEVANAS